MSLVVRKPVFGFFNLVPHNLGCTSTKIASGLKFRIKEVEGFTIRASKTKALVSIVVTAKLICVFVYAYAKSRFSNGATHIM